MTGDAAEQRIVWTLMSSNHRALGRSAIAYPTYEACRDAVHVLQREDRPATRLTTTVRATGRWSWRIDLDGRPVATSNRSYLRARECTYNLERFLEGVPVAEVAAGPFIRRS